MIEQSEKYHHHFRLYDMERLELSADEKARQLYEARLKEQRDIYAMTHGAVRQNSLDIARKLLMRNRPMDEIVEDTGLTYDEIKSLQKAI